MSPNTIRLDAFGRMLLVQRTASGWTVFDLGSDGKRRIAGDIAIPDFISAREIETYIGDLLHETATSRHPAVRRLPGSQASPAARLRRLQMTDIEDFRAFRLGALDQAPHAFAASAEEERGLTLAQIGERILPGPEGVPFVHGAFTEDGKLIGTCGFYRELGLKTRHIGWIWGMFVEHASRSRGIGGALLEMAVAEARMLPALRQIQLRVAANNTAARRIYSSAGFERKALLPRSLCWDNKYIDEHLMVLDLDPSQ